MRASILSAAVAVLLSTAPLSAVAATPNNFSITPWPLQSALVPRQATVFDDRPSDCPPCFNCNLEDFKCQQFGDCTKSNGKCRCPEGFGGDDCSVPLCGSPAEGRDRAPRPADQKECQCADGWDGINCNVCQRDDVCNHWMPDNKDGVCFRNGVVQKQNFHMCDVTNKKIVDGLDPRKPQVTFSCNKTEATCNFQLWVAQREAFYCALDTCDSSFQALEDRNVTEYKCEHIKCRCVPGGTLCGEGGGLDLSEFLSTQIVGPGAFRSTHWYDDSSKDKTTFQEPNMDTLITNVFGDESIFLRCHSGECLHKTEVPGYEKPIKTINTPLIAGVISGCALFVLAVVLLFAWLSRRAATKKYGMLRLEDEDEANAALMADHKPAALHFENVSYRIGGKQILSGVQGAVHPGQLLAIMGASGAGKTTFLDILARKNKRGVTHGNFYVNGESIGDDDFRGVIGFVDQEDTLLPTLTVHETILDSAMLRLPRDMSYAAKEQKVEDVEKQLGIYHIRDQLIGSAEGQRGISGGEKRRVGIACELVTSPSILFLDEPTSGLDSFNAFNVVECLVNLVKTYKRTVVFTIHQPRSNIVALFDQLVLLAKGRVVYSGPSSQCQNYFDSIGYACPPGFNIADYLVDLTMHAGDERTPLDDIIEAETRDGGQTRSSSLRAIKSIGSKTHLLSPSLSSSPAAEEALLRRPGHKRVSSVKQQQDRELFTRRASTEDQQPESRQSEDGVGEASHDPSWVKMSQQSGAVPRQILEDPHALPPEAHATTGTDLDGIISSYYTSEVAASVQEDIRDAVSTAGENNSPIGPRYANGSSNGGLKKYTRVGLVRQFLILSVRTWRNLYRNPMLMLTHYAISILLAVFLGFLFYGLGDSISGFQNRMGLLFFVLALFGFGTLTSLTAFASERLLFMRERAKGYYAPVAYFASKVFFDIVPLRLIPPILLSVIVYPMTGLVPAWPQFLIFVLILVLFNFATASVCLFIGIVINDGGTANLIGSLFMLFSLLFAGLLLNKETIPDAAVFLQRLSVFHYGLEGLLVNEVRYLTLTEHKYGLDVDVPGATILSTFGFNVQALWSDVIGLGVYVGVFIVLGYTAMHFLLVEKR